jgi:hypothetical protein
MGSYHHVTAGTTRQVAHNTGLDVHPLLHDQENIRCMLDSSLHSLVLVLALTYLVLGLLLFREGHYSQTHRVTPSGSG